MRLKSIIQSCLSYFYPSSPEVVEDYRNKYQKIDALLNQYPSIIEPFHQDLCQNLSNSKSGRKAKYTSEQILRCFIVMFIEGLSYRDTVIRIDDSEFLRDFVKLGWSQMMDHTFMARAYASISPETWEALNQNLGYKAEEKKNISGEKLRIDTTVVETNIHYPTDSSLLWDCARTLIRIFQMNNMIMRGYGMNHRFHPNKVKKLYTYISRNSKSRNKKTQRKVKTHYKELMSHVERLIGIGKALQEHLQEDRLKILDNYLPRAEKVLHQSQQRILHGVVLPADQKIYSIFEEHTELIKRGKAGKDIEFGHKVLISQSEEKFITHYQVLPKKKEDPALLMEALEEHQALFGTFPEVLAADKGFYKNRDEMKKLDQDIKLVSIAKKGRLTAEEEEKEKQKEFRDGQKFRAGVEGSISVLKRVFKQNCCMFKGFKHYANSVGCAVFCHNLVLLSRQ